MKKKTAGQPKKPPTTVIRVPADKIKVIEFILGRKGIAKNSTPMVNIRVPVSMVAAIRKVIK